MQYFDEAHAIWKTYVPKAGQGELLRAVEKLRDESMRNGNINWDTGFELLLAYLRSRLGDRLVFSPAVIARTTAVLDRLANHNDPYLHDDLYDELTDRVVEHFRHYGSQPHVRDPALGR